MFSSYQGITIASGSAIENAKALNYSISEEGSMKILEAPGGYKFLLTDKVPLNRKGT